MKLIGNGFASEIRSSLLRFSERRRACTEKWPSLNLNQGWVAEFDGLLLG